MDAKKINNFYIELETVATYNNESTMTDDEFNSNLKEIKKDLTSKGIKLPEIFEMVRNKSDFRSNMQKYDNYRERREILKKYFYPIIDMYEEEALEKVNSKEVLSIKDINKYLKDNNMQLKTKYGSISIYNLDSKSGGNGTVYFGRMSGIDVAVKFLINNSKEKVNRFLCEFGNIMLKLSEKEGIVKMFFYDEIIINDNKYSIICMKKYDNKLTYSDNYTEDEIIDITKQILNILKNVHDAGIIHRDLKPDNILLSENKIFIADFGIAYYNPEIFERTGHTTEGERLANFDFSAPEQRNSKALPSETMDIYALGQIIQWLVFGATTRGTGRKKLYQKYDTPRMHFLDDIVDKCLNDNPKERYQKVDEIISKIEKYNYSKSKSDINEEKSTVISEMKDEDFKELKEALYDIMSNICVTENFEREEPEKNFYTYDFITFTETTEFLENIPGNLNKLAFFDKAGISKFMPNNRNVFTSKEIDKKYFKLLHDAYLLVKEYYPNYAEAFVEYVKERLNDNFEMPF